MNSLVSMMNWIGLEQWILGYSKGNIVYQPFERNEFFQLIWCCCLHLNKPNIYDRLISKCNLPVCILTCIVHSMIDGLIKYLCQINWYYGIMQNIRDATMNLMKNWYWILSHILFIYYYDVWWFNCIESINYININNSMKLI